MEYFQSLLGQQTLFNPLIEFIQDNFGEVLIYLDGIMPFTSLAVILFLVLFSTSIYDMTHKEFWVSSKIILAQNLIKFLTVGIFISGYLSLSLMFIIVWFILDKYIDYGILHKYNKYIKDADDNNKNNYKRRGYDNI